MRLSSSPAAVCVAASFCLAATTTEAFFVPSAALRGAPLTRGQQATCSRCVGPAAVKMATMKGDASNPSQPDTPRRATFLSTAGGLLARRRGTASAPNASEGDATGSGQVARGGRRQRRAREVARRGFAAVATAVIVRSAFRAQPASAIMPKLRGTTAQQKMVEQAHREEKQAAIRERMEEEQQEGFESATSELDGQGIGGGGEEGAAAAAAAEGGGTVGGDSAGGAQASAAAVAKPEPPAQRKLTRKQRTAMMREKFDAKGFDPNTYPIKKADAGTFGAVIMGSFALYNIVSSFKGSTDVMGNQRRRVKVEGAKFDQQKEEFMNVDGEAEVDVDIMKELRDMKEKMAGPGDKYAKDTRKYNPDFAAEHPEDEYDNKIEEILRKSGKKGKTSKTGKTGIVFASDDSAANNDELLGEEGGENEEADSDSDSEGEAQSEADASAALKAKKDADVKRLQDLFNSSPSEDGDTPEDDMGEKRDLLP